MANATTQADERKEVDKVVRDFVAAFTAYYGQLDNPTRKSFRDWKASDLKQVRSSDLKSLRDALASESPHSFSAALIPNGMSREDFFRSILRETARRGSIPGEATIADVYINELIEDPAMRDKQVTLMRKPNLSENPLASVTSTAGVMAVRDGAIDLLARPDPYLRLHPDVVSAIKHLGNKVLPIKTDESAYDFGYTVGSMKQFGNNDTLNVSLFVDAPPSQVQQNYCDAVVKLFKDGRVYDNRDAFSLGLMQARIDSRANFEPTTDRVGLTGECPQPPRLASGGKAVNDKAASRQ